MYMKITYSDYMPKNSLIIILLLFNLLLKSVVMYMLKTESLQENIFRVLTLLSNFKNCIDILYCEQHLF